MSTQTASVNRNSGSNTVKNITTCAMTIFVLFVFLIHEQLGFHVINQWKEMLTDVSLKKDVKKLCKSKIFNENKI